jgi:hypothetical protein
VTARGWLGCALGWLCWSALPGAAAAAEGVQLRGSLYALGSQPRVKLYLWEMSVCPELWTSRYRRPDGALVVEDFTRFSGQRLAEHGYVRHTIGERSSVRVRGSRLEFRYRRGAKTKTETLSVDGVFLTGPAVFPFIQRSLPRLLAGEALEFKYGVLDRLDYFTFALTSESRPNDEARVVRIRARSLFVRMAIDPIYVTLSRAGKFMGIRGRTIIMEPKGERGVPIDADLVVEAEAPVVCTPEVAARAAPGKTDTGRAK